MTLSDSVMTPKCLDNCREAVKMNNLQETVKVVTQINQASCKRHCKSSVGHSCDLGLGDHESTESQEQAGLGGRLRPVLRPQCLREADIHHQMVNTHSCSHIG